ncbi:MAG: energy-coupling factor ABC transporter permease [Candidatus Bathyarchaeota archaeon]|nr:energy-coupling factor ABC transporter permease [Candidatus Bathyarchaeota archaeon]MCX8177310.1 energy-coupling factor ABC transporter permease [Candidatus Bathyarchaeota archaeon]MDW8193756.1 energy-coupling factor ABC transporter permease [Nitrososphaerota archaeon]
MHIPDGFLSFEITALMWIISIMFLAVAWRKAKSTYNQSLTPTLAVSSAFIFVAQMLNFPIAYGTSGHLVGGTFLAVVLGPYAAILSMTIVLLMQALFFADGGILAMGANIFNMAIIGGLSFFIFKLISGGNERGVKFYFGLSAASWLSVVLGALACGLEIGLSPVFSSAGGVAVTVPAMLFWHALIGLGEAAITTTILTQLYRLKPTVLGGLAYMRRGLHAGSS